MNGRWTDVQRRMARLDGVPNARDMGGLPTADGRHVKHGRLFRSALLTNASDEDIAFLHDVLHIECVVDLRTAYEVGKVPDCPIPGADYINMPILDKNNNMWMEMAKLPGTEPQRLRSFARTEMSKRMTRHMYTGFVMDEFCQLQYAAFIELLLNENREKNVLWHCSQGKDRTGLIAAFVLFALGCDRQTVVNDFALTNLYYKDVLDEALRQLREEGGSDDDATVIEAMIGVRVDYFEAALDNIDREFGSIDNYLNDILVVTPDDRRMLQSIYLE
ncbi:MAG: tyrosine-protein phosphatase [Bacteroidales bacterium]|nr:tyrosine-protein phosphatase [Bacteroidales bacterium]